MYRRDAIKLTMASLVGTASVKDAFAASEPLRILILGGTGFIGPHFVETLRARGHVLTPFNRGKRNASLFPDIETLLGDRNGNLEALVDRRWNALLKKLEG